MLIFSAKKTKNEQNVVGRVADHPDERRKMKIKRERKNTGVRRRRNKNEKYFKKYLTRGGRCGKIGRTKKQNAPFSPCRTASLVDRILPEGGRLYRAEWVSSHDFFCLLAKSEVYFTLAQKNC